MSSGDLHPAVVCYSWFLFLFFVRSSQFAARRSFWARGEVREQRKEKRRGEEEKRTGEQRRGREYSEEVALAWAITVNTTISFIYYCYYFYYYC